MFRQAHFQKNDVVDYNGEAYTVKAMGKDILLQHEKTGRKVHVKYKNMKDIKQIYWDKVYKRPENNYGYY